LNLSSSTKFFNLKIKSDRHIIQLLDVPPAEDQRENFFRWFRLIMFLIYFTGLFYIIIYDLSPDNDEQVDLPENDEFGVLFTARIKYV
jgi:hypothetical protein